MIMSTINKTDQHYLEMAGFTHRANTGNPMGETPAAEGGGGVKANLYTYMTDTPQGGPTGVPEPADAPAPPYPAP